MPRLDDFCRICRVPLSNGVSYRFSREHAFTSNGRTLVAIVSVPWSELEKAHHCKACYRRLMAIQKAEEDLLAQKEALRRDFHNSGMFFRDETVAMTSSKRSREPATPHQTINAEDPSSATKSPMPKREKLLIPTARSLSREHCFSISQYLLATHQSWQLH